MTNSERALVPGSSGGLPAYVERRTRIANRVLGELERQDTEAFFRRHPEFFRLVVSLYYPLEVGLIERFKNSWDWSLLGITSIASPEFGTSSGGLQWNQVKEVMCRFLEPLPNLDVEIYHFDPNN